MLKKEVRECTNSVGTHRVEIYIFHEGWCETVREHRRNAFPHHYTRNHDAFDAVLNTSSVIEMTFCQVVCCTWKSFSREPHKAPVNNCI